MSRQTVLPGLWLLSVVLAPLAAEAIPGRHARPAAPHADRDRDGIPDHVEDPNENGVVDPGETDPLHHDTDGDGVPDGVEDANQDGRRNVGETSARHHDTDGDGVPDGIEDANQNGRVDPGESDPRRRCSGPAEALCGNRGDVDGAERGPRIPEPMVVDLVRGLGARRHELEVNALAVTRRTAQGWQLAWSPEVEWTPRDGFALELELPFVNNRLEAVKVAGQYTLGTFARGRGIHGLQAMLEWGLAGDTVRTTLFHIVGWRFSARWSSQLMLGASAVIDPVTSDATPRAQAHPSVFCEVHPRFLTGLEMAWSWEPGRSAMDVIPQVRWRPSDHLTVQLGGGVGVAQRRAAPLLGARVAVEW